MTDSFGNDYGLKYYRTGIDSAKQQAKSVFERFREYQVNGGTDSLDEFLAKRGLDNTETMLHDPIYTGQVRIIPKDQLGEATMWLEQKIAKESMIRPEQAERYRETLELLNDRIKDNDGTESVALTKEDAEYLARLAKKGEVSEGVLKNLGISAEELIKFEDIMRQSFKAGTTAAVISLVLKIAPEIYKAIDYLVRNGETDERQFKKIGFAAFSGGAEGFLHGSVSAALITACKAGLMGEALKSVNPSVIGAVTVLAFNAMQNAFKVAAGKMRPGELAEQLIKDMFVSTCALTFGGIGQAVIGIPVLGYLIGSFVGSLIGGLAYNAGRNVVMSFCVHTGFTFFGLVEQDYELPDDVLNAMGIEVFKYETVEPEWFVEERVEPQWFEEEYIRPETLNITILRRGVIGVSKIGYVQR